MLPLQNQFTAGTDHFAECILHDRTPRTPGEEGLRDQLLIDALYRPVDQGGSTAV